MEVRQAAHAFNAMQRQIRGYMAERMQILTAVTHDLKTPLTRMRLEKCADEALKDRLQADLDAMQSLVEEGLELARSLDATQSPQTVDLAALLQSLCDDAAETGISCRTTFPHMPSGPAVRGLIRRSANACLIFDDTVLDKRHSFKIDLVRRQYSGTEHGVVKGIGVVNCVYVNLDTGEHWIIDCRHGEMPMPQGPRPEEPHRLRHTRLALPDETRQKVENEYLRPQKQPALKVYEGGV